MKIPNLTSRQNSTLFISVHKLQIEKVTPVVIKLCCHLKYQNSQCIDTTFFRPSTNRSTYDSVLVRRVLEWLIGRGGGAPADVGSHAEIAKLAKTILTKRQLFPLFPWLALCFKMLPVFGHFCGSL